MNCKTCIEKTAAGVRPVGLLCAVVCVLVSLWSQVCVGQFIPYSQYYNAPLLTNPSLAGTGDHTQLTVHYRRARVSNYETPSLSFVRPFFRDSGLRGGAGGVNLISQKAGPGSAYQVMGATATFAYNIYVNKNQYISAGLQGGVVSKKLDASALTTDSQYNFGAFDPSLSTGENISSASEVKPVINAGFSWTMTDHDGTQRATLGVGFFNMNRPSFDVFAGSNAEEIAFTVTGEMMVYQHDRVSVHPTFRYIGSGSALANIGTQVRYALPPSNSDVMVGAWYKTSKGMTAAIQYTSDRYVLAASTDLSVATDLPENIENAVEISFGWRLKRKANVKRPQTTRDVASETSLPEPVQEAEPVSVEEESTEETSGQIAIEQPMIEQFTAPEDTTTTVAPAREEEITPEERETLEVKISFSLGSSDLASESVLFVETRLVPLLKNHSDLTLHITGHSCTMGDKAVNEKISLERAQIIRRLLIGYGVSENQVVATGMDFQKPIASNDTEEGRQKNRRVEFELVRQ